MKIPSAFPRDGSGVKQLTFPTLFNITPPADDSVPYAATYMIVDSSNTDGSYPINTMDQVDNSFSGAPVTVIKDFDDPTVSLAVEEAAGFAFSMTLSSEDSLSGPSGVYDVEYRDGEIGQWQLWQGQTNETDLQFTAIPGHSLYFRVRSKDRVDNEGLSAVMGPYEAKLETIKYYYFNGQRVAMRRCDVGGACDDPLYLHGDHLGSVSLTTNSSGAVVAQTRYMPSGEVRWITNTMPTDLGFTGQRLDGFGLMDFNARFYSQRLGRFISADSLIPNPGSPMDFDRYMYGLGNPMRFVDPSGHHYCDSEYAVPEECSGYNPDLKIPYDDLLLLTLTAWIESSEGRHSEEARIMMINGVINRYQYFYSSSNPVIEQPFQDSWNDLVKKTRKSPEDLVQLYLDPSNRKHESFMAVKELLMSEYNNRLMGGSDPINGAIFVVHLNVSTFGKTNKEAVNYLNKQHEIMSTKYNEEMAIQDGQLWPFTATISEPYFEPWFADPWLIAAASNHLCVAGYTCGSGWLNYERLYPSQPY